MDNECTCTFLPVYETTDDEGRLKVIPPPCEYCRDKARKELIRAQQVKEHG
jgi:hypothetical protein